MSIEAVHPRPPEVLSVEDAASGVRRAAPPPSGPAVPPAPDAVPEEPTTEAMAAVQTAARVYEQLRASDRRLHFMSTDDGVRIEVYDGNGELIRRIPPNEALALASGLETTWLA